MKHLLSIIILAAGLLLHAPAIQAQDCCKNLSLQALRGTYSFSATGWQDLSEMNPGLPSGYAPVSILGIFTINDQGDLTGWSLVNAGGVQMNVKFVDSQFGAPNADCSFPISLSMRMEGGPEDGMVLGPYSYVGVIAGDQAALEIHFMMLGTGPGTHVDLQHAKRISMKSN